ncbi:hypothetical protein [Burkholderia sp. BCC0044]|uniref:hypothetical protein n=1 Tax=Burkholderia sp. BCC0044 TaxID=2676295 RepID=UPI00158AA237|nr:hypothetical protein [Burkholderia sp. BCC0044]
MIDRTTSKCRMKTHRKCTNFDFPLKFFRSRQLIFHLVDAMRQPVPKTISNAIGQSADGAWRHTPSSFSAEGGWPGGWKAVQRTRAHVFDKTQTPPFLKI